MKFSIFLSMAIVTLAYATNVDAQVRFRVGTGLSTQWIVNDNPATYRIVSEDTTLPTGGSFDGMQFGWGIRAYADLDKQKTFRVPFGFDYTSYTGAQSWAATFNTVLLKHTNQAYTMLAGFEYSFLEFPLAYARVYSGVEFRGTMFTNNTLQFVRTYANGIPTTDETVLKKPDAFRLGALARIGIEGEIYYPVFLNTSVGLGAVNFIGRDMKQTSEGGRGELLTTDRRNEGPESLVWQVNFTFMIQVRL